MKSNKEIIFNSVIAGISIGVIISAVFFRIYYESISTREEIVKPNSIELMIGDTIYNYKLSK